MHRGGAAPAVQLLSALQAVRAPGRPAQGRAGPGLVWSPRRLEAGSVRKRAGWRTFQPRMAQLRQVGYFGRVRDDGATILAPVPVLVRAALLPAGPTWRQSCGLGGYARVDGG
ncbi:hypothetical protein SBRY_90289 [Actinacidiphila bryophytorum]|uniref:Uncharacterized protein n=1 Tax=Actinacidiphila bryophytorum TaxID=1436133 RepID=A0A9W4H7Y5_9ACTN|nr:hypothetical protein SBRY_90289 [Actinacidiphila bryophytorum]